MVNKIKEKARQYQKSIVLPETSDFRVLDAAAKVQKDGFAKLILLGNKEQIYADAKGLDISKAEIISMENSEQYIDKLVELRAHKGVTKEKARELLQNPLYFGAMLVREKKADGMVAGSLAATADVLRAALQVVGTAKDSKIVSAFFLMVVPNCEFGFNGVFVFADCGLVQNPNAEELAHIAISSAKSFTQLTGESPFVALLSHSTYGSATHSDIDKVIQATQIAQNLAPNIMLDGELQLDAAIVPSVGKSKAKDSKVAGRANVLVFPDLDSGNIGYKLTQRLAKAEAYGPITQGLAAPINDLSRGCSADDIVGAVAITALQAI